MVVCDRLSKITHFVVTAKETLAEELVRLFRNNIWKLHDLPESVISDRRPQFTADLIRKSNKMLGIETRLLTVFHPQTDRQTEQMNQELEQCLRFFVNHNSLLTIDKKIG